MRSQWVRAAVAVAAIAFSVAACGTTGSPDAAVKASITPTCDYSPITGTCFDPEAPVLVVKIDDVSEARPQFHLNQADIVLVEPVEGGLTRLFVAYNSTLPETVGPIRSARITDTDLVPIFGNPLFAYSGSQSKLVPYLKEAPMQMVGAPQGGTGYSRLTDRPAPHNYVADVQELLTRVDDPASAKLNASSYWKITTKSNVQGTEIGKALVHWPASDKTFIWDKAAKNWAIDVYTKKLMTQIDAAGTVERARATNVVIMESQLQDSDFGDKFGARTPYPQTIGSGNGMVLIDGKAIPATWKRDAATDLPHWYAQDGSELALRPGNTWWLIVTDLESVKLSPLPTPAA